MVGRFILKKNVRFLQKQAAQSNSAALTTGKNVYNLISRRTAEGIHGKLKVCVEVPCVGGIELFLNLCLTGTKFVKICIRVTKSLVYLIEFSEQVCDWLYALFYYFKDCFARFKIRFLLQISH